MSPEHAPHGDPCIRCTLPAARHRQRSRPGRYTPKPKPAKRPKRAKPAKKPSRASYLRTYRETHPAPPRQIIAIDGEGWTDAKGHHRYVYMAACTADELVAELRAASPFGLTFDEVAAWLLELPKGALLCGFALGYDKTKWIESLPNHAIYSLTHPNLRRGKRGVRAVSVDGYRVNMVSTMFSVRADTDDGNGTRTVWDLFKFYQCAFVKALAQWDIGTPEERERIAAMKEKRGTFAGIRRAEELYCRNECHLLAKLARALLEAHEAEGIELRSYYGPGSTAAHILKECGAEKENAKVPRPMLHVLERAYFGGRFEGSWVGPVRKKIHVRDIASAYPYALAQMPCMRPKCGTWVHVKRAKAAKHLRTEYRGAMVPTVYRFTVEPHPKACKAWGPLPYRTRTSDIVYPSTHPGGWAWHAELSEAQALHPGVTVSEMWTWKRKASCKCPPPFRDRIAALFNRRLEVGKTARGIVVKLALNSMYGKSAQRVGSPRFRCLVRAAMITAYVRGMLLAAVRAAKDPWSVLDLATDSVISTEEIRLPAPTPLGTHAMAKKMGKTPLGGWEAKEWDDEGAFFARPGLRFPIAADAEPSTTAARGIGTKILHAHRKKILAHWKRRPGETFTLAMPSMFMGAKSAITIAQGEHVRSALYGRWFVPKKTIAFTPTPKRQRVDLPKWDANGERLYLRDLRDEPESSTGKETAPKLRRGVVLDTTDRTEEEEWEALAGKGEGAATEEEAFRTLRDEQHDWTDPSPV